MLTGPKTFPVWLNPLNIEGQIQKLRLSSKILATSAHRIANRLGLHLEVDLSNSSLENYLCLIRNTYSRQLESKREQSVTVLWVKTLSVPPTYDSVGTQALKKEHISRQPYLLPFFCNNHVTSFDISNINQAEQGEKPKLKQKPLRMSNEPNFALFYCFYS